MRFFWTCLVVVCLQLSTVFADSRLICREPQAIDGGGTMVVCHRPELSAGPVDVVIHFHGAVETCTANFERAGIDGVLVIVNFKGLSGAYSKPFRDSADLFDVLLEKTKTELGAIGEHCFRRVIVSTFSAGFGAVREILKSTKAFNRIDGIIAADSIYAGLEENADTRIPRREHMKDFLRFAKLASEGKKTFLITHTQLETPYASTRETADYVINELGLKRMLEPPSEEEDSLVLTSRVVRGNFTVFGYRGDTGDDHLEHLRMIGRWWGMLPLARHSEKSEVGCANEERSLCGVRRHGANGPRSAPAFRVMISGRVRGSSSG